MLFESIQRVMCVTSCCLFLFCWIIPFFMCAILYFFKENYFVVVEIRMYFFVVVIFEFNLTFIFLKILFRISVFEDFNFGLFICSLEKCLNFTTSFISIIKILELLSMMIVDENMTNESF